MRYRRLKVANFRGVESREIFFDEGVTVVWGPNESGKSSLREAIELLRDVKDTSNATRVRQVKPVHRDAAPMVELEMETGPYTLVYRKQWLKSRSTVLEVTQNGVPSHYTGAEAEEKFTKLLGETVDLNLLKELDVQQGSSLTQPRLATIKALHEALGDSPQQDSTDTFMEAVEAEYLKYFTKTGQIGKELRQARVQVEEARQELEKATERYLAVERLSVEFRENRTRIATLEQQLNDAERRLADALAKEKEIHVALGSAQEYEEKHKQVKTEIERLEFAVSQRQEAAVELDHLRKEEATLEERIAQNKEALEGAEQRAVAARSDLDAARTREEEARNRAHTLEKSLANLRDNQELQTLKRRAKQVEDSFAGIEEAQKVLAGNAATKERLDRVLKAQREVELAGARVLAAAPKIRVEAHEETTVSGLSGDTPRVVRGGEVLEAEAPSNVDICIPGVISVQIRPGASVEDLDLLAADAQVALDDALREVGAQTVVEAQVMGEKRRTAQTDLERAQTMFANAQDGSSREELQTRMAILEGRLGTSADDLGQQTQSQERDELESAALSAKEEHSASSAMALKCQNALDMAQRKEATVKEEGVELRMERAQLNTRLELAEHRLKEYEDVDEDALAEQIESLKLNEVRFAEQIGSCKETLESLDPDRTRAELGNLTALVPSKREDLEEARTREVVLSTVLDERTGEGLYDHLQQCEIRCNQAEADWERINARSASVQLLWTTLTKHRDAAQQKYVAPLQDGLKDLGKLVFGRSFSAQVNDKLEIVSRTVDGVTIKFNDLSVGAQEQLALLGRLAVARIVDPTSSAPVILDDTLGFADPERLASLNLVLNTAGKDAQIIVLTCQPDRFQNIGGAKTVQLSSAGLEATGPE